MSAETRDPQTRLFRRLFQGIHLVVAVVFCSLLAVGVWRGVDEIRPERATPPGSVQECLAAVDALRGELLDRLGSFPHAPSAAEEGRAFERWSVGYRARLLQSRAACRKPEDASPAQAEALGDAYGAVIRTLDLSAITATHWARHLGPSLDEVSTAIEEARRAR